MLLRDLRILVLCLLASAGTLCAQNQRIDLHFSSNQSVPLPASITTFEEFYQALPRTGNWRLSGHTDALGSASANQTLSERRVNWVKDQLIVAGWEAGQVEEVGEGEQRPVTSNESEAGRAQNRRVEVEWIPAKSAEIEPLAEGKGWIFSFLAEEGLDAETPSGVKIKLPPNALIRSDSTPVSGEVKVVFRDFRDRLDQVFADFSLDFERNGRWFLYNSAGMFEIRSFQGADTLGVLPGNQIHIEYPYNDSLPDLNFYKFKGLSGEWEPLAEVPDVLPEAVVIDLPEEVVVEPPLDKPVETPKVPVPPEVKLPRSGSASVEWGLDADSVDIDSINLSASSSSEDEPDSLRLKFEEVDTLKTKLRECPVCDTACFAMWFGYNLFNSIELEGPTARKLDLRYFYTAYSQPDSIEEYYCHDFQVRLNQYGAGRRRYLELKLAHDFSPLPEFKDWSLILKSSKRNAGKYTNRKLKDVVLYRKRRSNTLKIKSGEGPTLKVKYQLPGAKRKENRASLDQRWGTFRQAANEQNAVFNQHLARYRTQAHCFMPDSVMPANPAAMLNWMKTRHEPLRKQINYLFEFCLLPDSTCFCKGEPTIIVGDTFRCDTVGPGAKEILFSNVGIPVVLLNEFGIYNFDAVSELPDPRWIAARYVNEKGESVPIYKAFLMVGKINGVIGLASPTWFKVSPAVANMILAFGPQGPIYYCPASDFPDVTQYENVPLTIPLKTIPWQPGEDPVDLRETLIFE